MSRSVHIVIHLGDSRLEPAPVASLPQAAAELKALGMPLVEVGRRSIVNGTVIEIGGSIGGFKYTDAEIYILSR